MQFCPWYVHHPQYSILATHHASVTRNSAHMFTFACIYTHDRRRHSTRNRSMQPTAWSQPQVRSANSGRWTSHHVCLSFKCGIDTLCTRAAKYTNLRTHRGAVALGAFGVPDYDIRGARHVYIRTHTVSVPVSRVCCSSVSFYYRNIVVKFQLIFLVPSIIVSVHLCGSRSTLFSCLGTLALSPLALHT